MNTATASGSVWSARRPKISAALVLLAAAWLVPFLVHLVPWHGERPLGVYLLPVFWTTLVAVQLYGVGFALAVGLVTPLVNLALTGLPAAARIGPMAVEVVGFVLVSGWLARKAPRFSLAAPLAYAAGKALAIGVQWTVPVFDYTRDPAAHLLASLQNGLAGLVILTLINLGLVWWARRRKDRDAE
jgi:hypothetical protein